VALFRAKFGRQGPASSCKLARLTYLVNTGENMIRFIRTPKLLPGTLLMAISALVAIGNPQTGQSSEGKLLQVKGTVQVNGANAVSGAPIASPSAITTRQNSSAVVSLGKLGRVEVLPDTTMKLQFANSDVSVEMLDAGRVRISSSSNVSASVTTKDGSVVSTGNQRNEFVVDTKCGNTFVAVAKGRVELRAGSSVKQIAAGGQDTAGTATPGCTPAP
jgi:hypothetical protein